MSTFFFQDPEDRKTIICDSAMIELLGVDKFHGFGMMAKLLAPHLGKAGGPVAEHDGTLDDVSGLDDDNDEYNHEDGLDAEDDAECGAEDE